VKFVYVNSYLFNSLFIIMLKGRPSIVIGLKLCCKICSYLCLRITGRSGVLCYTSVSGQCQLRLFTDEGVSSVKTFIKSVLKPIKKVGL
jgi:hypothetical protein